MNRVKFGALQKLCAGYLDGQISANSEIVKKYIGDFFFDEDDYSELCYILYLPANPMNYDIL